jgi:O-antigen ligase
MAIKTVIFVLFYMTSLGGSIFFHPMVGVVGYVMTYVVAPSSQWWASPLVDMGMRFSFFMAAAMVLGMIMQSQKLRLPGRLYRQEILFFIFIIWIFLSSYIGLNNYGNDNFAIKLFKVSVFLWMLVRIVDNQKKYEIFLWALVITSFYIGYDALSASTAQFGRLNHGVGGSDFAEGNFLAAHFAMVLPFIGVLLIKGSSKQRFLLILATVLLVNGIILCRSRGVFLALGMGVFTSIYLAPKGWRSKIISILIIGLIGSFFLVDKGFIQRMKRINTDITDISSQDDSASGRILAWEAALSMAGDYPLGIGQGNFKYYVGEYQPSIPGKDTHNTYLRALAELGLPGLFLMMLMIWNAFHMLKIQKRRIEGYGLSRELLLHIYAVRVALVIFLVAGMFITETYIEEFFWLLMLPVLIERTVDKEQWDRQIAISG